jgi:hypothetical protein
VEHVEHTPKDRGTRPAERRTCASPRRARGGRLAEPRPRPGRKPLPPGARKVRRSVSLEARHWAWLAGKGNVSAALRALVEAALAADRSR